MTSGFQSRFQTSNFPFQPPPLPPPPSVFPKTMLILDSADHITYTTSNWGAGGIRELMLDANKIEQVLQYQSVIF